MKAFHCDSCGQLVYFENTSCLNCGAVLAFLPDQFEIKSLVKADELNWKSASEKQYQLCRNYIEHDVCNWAVLNDTQDTLCISCRLNSVIPDLSLEGNKIAWARFEAAKRRLNFSLLGFGLPLENKIIDPLQGLSYEFKADAPRVPVLTGHEFGVITINLAEADDAEREKRRVELHEPYRTILGHFRHEIGHYYWDRFFENKDAIWGFRAVFGDEREDYDEALKRHYMNGFPADWQENYISTYATSHPWEDWAETWAHYLHMSDTLETAAASGLALKPPHENEPSVELKNTKLSSFDSMMDGWFPITYLLNNLNRGLGLRDAYPFVLPSPVIDKLRFVHDSIAKATSQT